MSLVSLPIRSLVLCIGVASLASAAGGGGSAGGSGAQNTPASGQAPGEPGPPGSPNNPRPHPTTVPPAGIKGSARIEPGHQDRAAPLPRPPN